MANPIVTITMENGDVMKAELYPEIAPITVENFVNLVKDGFYDGLTFHRIINGFMITAFDLAPYMAHEFTWDHVENPDKGTGLTYVADHLNISTDDCYAFGDSNNDISMFKAAGHGIAMGNACDELKEIAEYVTDSVNDDGIYHAFEHYHLI